MKKNNEAKEMIIPVLYYTDENGKKVYDYEEMANYFENMLSKLDPNIVVMCSIEGD